MLHIVPIQMPYKTRAKCPARELAATPNSHPNSLARDKLASSDARLVFEQVELSIGPLGTLYRRHGVECYRERREGPRWRPALLALLLAMGATDNQRFGLPRSCLNALEGLGFLLNQLRHVLR